MWSSCLINSYEHNSSSFISGAFSRNIGFKFTFMLWLLTVSDCPLRDWNSLYVCSAKSSRSCITYSNPFLYPLILFCLFLCLICIQPTTPGPTGCWPHHIHWRTECLLQRCLWLRPPYRGALPAGQGRPPCSRLSPVAKHIRGPHCSWSNWISVIVMNIAACAWMEEWGE